MAGYKQQRWTGGNKNTNRKYIDRQASLQKKQDHLEHEVVRRTREQEINYYRRRAKAQTSVNDQLGYYYTAQVVLNWLLLSCKQFYEWRRAACKVRNCSANKIIFLIYGQFSTSISTHPLTNPFWLRCDSSHIPVQRTTISLYGVVNYT